MMKSIERRVTRIEKKLNIGNEQTGVFIAIISEREVDSLPEPLEEWITYKEARARCGQVGIFMADPAAELEAREQQKATESNKKAEK